MSEAIRVLIVEDLPTDAELAEREIGKALGACQFLRVETREDYLAALDGYGPALIVSDFKLPHFDGLTALTLALDRCPDVPFIIVTGSMNEDTAVECMKAGAWDYVIKEHVKRLGGAVQSALERQRVQVARKRAEEGLRHSEAEYRSLFVNAIMGISQTSPDGQLIRVNQAYARMHGYSSPLEMMNAVRSADALYANPDDRAEVRRTLSEKGVMEPREVPLVGRDGSRFVVLVSAREVRDNSGNLVCYQAEHVDITARKRAEEEREKLEEQLRMAQKLEAIGSLAGGIAHDFNNLLTVILSGTDFAMAEAREDEHIREELVLVRKAGERAATLTRQLLAFSRKQVLQPVVLNLNQVAAGVEKMLRRILGEDIDYVQVLAPDLGVVRADPGQIEQVLMNLVVNARDAMPSGGKLTIETSNVDLDEEYAARRVGVKPGPYVHFAVTDNGCGMDTATQARIFDPFFTTKERGKGTGLGLSTVYGIVKQSGGNIWVYSEPGRGTTFRVYLPRKLAATTKDTNSRLAAVSARPTGTETILVVEDDAAMCDITKRMLGRSGYTVLTAATADVALKCCKTHLGTIHLLLTDVVMPEVGGKVLAERVALARPGIKILYMSGYTNDAIVHHGTLDPGTHFIGKPFSAEDLATKVREVLDGDIASPAADQDM